MLEELCKSAFFDACKKVKKRAPLVSLKGNPYKKVNEFDGFFGGNEFYVEHNWSSIPLKKAMHQRKGSTLLLSWAWFNENADDLCRAFIWKNYKGDVAQAMRVHGTFENLFACFVADFCERKARFMENQTKEIDTVRNALLAKGKTPQSHGGVANLLKVLTKTMYEQGSTVYSIAKVQYAICVQAGIFLPDEFLTDILVAHDELEEVGIEGR